MRQSGSVECKYLVDGEFCKSIIKDEEGKATRLKWCEEKTKNLCCYLCVRREFCDISCMYLGKPQTSTNIDQKLASTLRAQALEMISQKAKMNFPITESDCPFEERQGVNVVVQMLNERETNLKSIQEIEKKLKWKQMAPEPMRKVWSNQIRDLGYQNMQLMAEASEKAKALADSISRHVLTAHNINFQGLIDALKNKGIVLEKLECPRCGGVLNITEVPKKEQVLQCKYCGSSILALNLYEKFKEIIRQ